MADVGGGPLEEMLMKPLLKTVLLICCLICIVEKIVAIELVVALRGFLGIRYRTWQ